METANAAMCALVAQLLAHIHLYLSAESQLGTCDTVDSLLANEVARLAAREQTQCNELAAFKTQVAELKERERMQCNELAAFRAQVAELKAALAEQMAQVDKLVMQLRAQN